MKKIITTLFLVVLFISFSDYCKGQTSITLKKYEPEENLLTSKTYTTYSHISNSKFVAIFEKEGRKKEPLFGYTYFIFSKIGVTIHDTEGKNVKEFNLDQFTNERSIHTFKAHLIDNQLHIAFGAIEKKDFFSYHYTIIDINTGKVIRKTENLGLFDANEPSLFISPDRSKIAMVLLRPKKKRSKETNIWFCVKNNNGKTLWEKEDTIQHKKYKKGLGPFVHQKDAILINNQGNLHFIIRVIGGFRSIGEARELWNLTGEGQKFTRTNLVQEGLQMGYSRLIQQENGQLLNCGFYKKDKKEMGFFSLIINPKTGKITKKDFLPMDKNELGRITRKRKTKTKHYNIGQEEVYFYRFPSMVEHLMIMNDIQLANGDYIIVGKHFSRKAINGYLGYELGRFLKIGIKKDGSIVNIELLKLINKQIVLSPNKSFSTKFYLNDELYCLVQSKQRLSLLKISKDDEVLQMPNFIRIPKETLIHNSQISQNGEYILVEYITIIGAKSKRTVEREIALIRIDPDDFSWD